MANIDNVQLPDGSSYNIVDNTSGFATQNYVDSAVASVTKTTIGLGNVDNTSDLNKPISTATQAALDTLDEDKADKTDIATVESGTTASRAYSVGELVYVSGTLYRIKTAIASGATFTVGTNVEVTNVSNEFKGLQSNQLGNGISVSVDYIFPSDGYILCTLPISPSQIACEVAVNNVILISALNNNAWVDRRAVYVRKGMKITALALGTGVTCNFYPFN